MELCKPTNLLKLLLSRVENLVRNNLLQTKKYFPYQNTSSEFENLEIKSLQCWLEGSKRKKCI